MCRYLYSVRYSVLQINIKERKQQIRKNQKNKEKKYKKTNKNPKLILINILGYAMIWNP